MALQVGELREVSKSIYFGGNHPSLGDNVVENLLLPCSRFDFVPQVYNDTYSKALITDRSKHLEL